MRKTSRCRRNPRLIHTQQQLVQPTRQAHLHLAPKDVRLSVGILIHDSSELYSVFYFNKAANPSPSVGTTTTTSSAIGKQIDAKEAAKKLIQSGVMNIKIRTKRKSYT